jgi:hypothetical protein
VIIGESFANFAAYDSPSKQHNNIEGESMKALLIAALLLATATTSAQVHVRGYTKKDGTYVAPHMRSSPNSTTLDNYSTKGNVNPYTGEPGTKDPNPYDTARSAPAVQLLQPLQPNQTTPPQKNRYDAQQPAQQQF